jgi:D-tyrosyl-tRNA(Tyr) deacylase
MRVVAQRVKESTVSVEGQVVGKISRGLLVLLGIAHTDSVAEADYLVDKIINLRIFEDDQGKMNRSLLDTDGQMLVVSQFTLLGDCRKGRRPSFINAAPPEMAEALYDYFTQQARSKGIVVHTGRFRAMMEVQLINDGPVTLVLER